MNQPLNIALIEPFFCGSHQQWANGLKKFSAHKIDVFHLPGKHWKWRMYGGAIKLAQEFLASEKSFDLILATDMLDLNLFLSLTRKKTSNIPVITYFHENQLTYPWSSRDKEIQSNRDRHYGFINYTTALSSDLVIFNSHYHRQSFLDALTPFLKRLPDHKTSNLIPQIESKSQVLHVGIDFEEIDSLKRQVKASPKMTILWNHRWEEDKNPNDFLRFLRQLKKGNFELVLLGERSADCSELVQIENEFKDHLLYSGYCSRQEYIEWLCQCDVLPVTSNQDFFGISIVEAMCCGVIPILPDRLSYRELLPESCLKSLLYNNSDDLISQFNALNLNSDLVRLLKQHIKKFNWKEMIHVYDEQFLACASISQARFAKENESTSQ